MEKSDFDWESANYGYGLSGNKNCQLEILVLISRSDKNIKCDLYKLILDPATCELLSEYFI